MLIGDQVEKYVNIIIYENIFIDIIVQYPYQDTKMMFYVKK